MNILRSQSAYLKKTYLFPEKNKYYLGANDIMLGEGKKEVGKLNSHIALKSSDLVTAPPDPLADRLATRVSLPNHYGLRHHCFYQAPWLSAHSFVPVINHPTNID